MSEPNFHQLRIFYTVAAMGNFSRASEELSISQPPVSVQVKFLEEYFGPPLLNRAGRELHLTEAGRLVFKNAQRIFRISEAMIASVDELKGLQAGHLSIAASTTPWDCLLPELIGRFKSKYSKVDVGLRFSNTPAVVQHLLQHEVDLGYVGDPLDIDDLDVVPFHENEIVIFAKPDHSSKSSKNITLKDMENEGRVLREPASATRK